MSLVYCVAEVRREPAFRSLSDLRGPVPCCEKQLQVIMTIDLQGVFQRNAKMENHTALRNT